MDWKDLLATTAAASVLCAVAVSASAGTADVTLIEDPPAAPAAPVLEGLSR